jgi:hypothetical protein
MPAFRVAFVARIVNEGRTRQLGLRCFGPLDAYVCRSIPSRGTDERELHRANIYLTLCQTEQAFVPAASIVGSYDYFVS